MVIGSAASSSITLTGLRLSARGVKGVLMGRALLPTKGLPASHCPVEPGSPSCGVGVEPQAAKSAHENSTTNGLSFVIQTPTRPDARCPATLMTESPRTVKWVFCPRGYFFRRCCELPIDSDIIPKLRS